jgi:hypothetical protein
MRCDVGDGINLVQVLVNPECLFIFYVMWEASVLVGPLLALQEGSAVGWIIKELSISFQMEKNFLTSS